MPIDFAKLLTEVLVSKTFAKSLSFPVIEHWMERKIDVRNKLPNRIGETSIKDEVEQVKTC